MAFTEDVVAAKAAPWRVHAACRGMTGAMFPVVERGQPADYAAALTLCAACPVVEPCRAAGAHERHGVWGGTTPTERVGRRKAVS